MPHFPFVGDTLRCELGDHLDPMLGHPKTQSLLRNSILKALSPLEFSRISRFLQPFALKERAVLQEYKRRIQYIHFIETGIVSRRTIEPGNVLETAIVGSQGAIGVSVALGSLISMDQSIVLFPGSAFRISTEDLFLAMQEQPRIRECILCYVQALMSHGSQTALCGARHVLEKRLACWLCLARDFSGRDVLPITHDKLSMILGLRRAGVSEALSRFEEQRLVRKMRGLLEITRCEELERMACRCYGAITNAYQLAELPTSRDGAIGTETS